MSVPVCVENSFSFSCQSLQIAENIINNNIINGSRWAKIGSNDGTKQIYTCSMANCKARLGLFMHKNYNRVSIYTSDRHNHNDLLQPFEPKVIYSI